ncbi:MULTISPECIES: hypothetical protein [Streptomyces]
MLSSAAKWVMVAAETIWTAADCWTISRTVATLTVPLEVRRYR